MCLNNDLKALRKLLNSDRKWFVCYKAISIMHSYNGKPVIVTPYLYKDINTGWFRSNSNRRKPFAVAGAISKGIHVYLTNGNYIRIHPLVRCYALKEDLLGADAFKNAVFKKIYIPKNAIGLALAKFLKTDLSAAHIAYIESFGKNAFQKAIQSLQHKGPTEFAA